KPSTERVIVQLPIAVASFLLNEKRDEVADIQKRSRSEITLVPNATLETPHYEIKRIRGEQLKEEDNGVASYRIHTDVEIEAPVEPIHSSTAARQSEQPAVRRIARTDAPPHAERQTTRSTGASTAGNRARQSQPPTSLFARLWQALKRLFTGTEATAESGRSRHADSRHASRNSAQRSSHNQRRSGRSGSQGNSQARKSAPKRQHGSNAGTRANNDSDAGSSSRSRRGSRSDRNRNNNGRKAGARGGNRQNSNSDNQNRRKPTDNKGARTNASSADQRKGNTPAAKENGNSV